MPAKRASPEAGPAAGEDPLLGKPAPEVRLLDQDEKPLRLPGLRGSNVVLYFYPKDDTPGCTTEACQFRDALPGFEGVDAVVIGVSPDDAESHRKFRAKHGLPFALAFDPSGQVLKAFDVWREKHNYGRTYMGVERSTFLLDKQGVVRGVWRKVKADGHAAEVLAAVRALRG